MAYSRVYLLNDIKEFYTKTHLQPILGLDIGEKTIGIAIADANWRMAVPLLTLTRQKFTKDADRLIQLIQTRNIAGLVIGYPLMLDGSAQNRAQSCKSFAQNLCRLETWHWPIILYDERFSTVSANRILIDKLDNSRKKRAKLVDQIAACVILQNALDRLNHLVDKNERV